MLSPASKAEFLTIRAISLHGLKAVQDDAINREWRGFTAL
jgi:hypothetical protein